MSPGSPRASSRSHAHGCHCDNRAGEIARDFNCSKDEVQFIGARGRAAELAKR